MSRGGCGKGGDGERGLDGLGRSDIVLWNWLGSDCTPLILKIRLSVRCIFAVSSLVDEAEEQCKPAKNISDQHPCRMDGTKAGVIMWH